MYLLTLENPLLCSMQIKAVRPINTNKQLKLITKNLFQCTRNNIHELSRLSNDKWSWRTPTLQMNLCFHSSGMQDTSCVHHIVLHSLKQLQLHCLAIAYPLYRRWSLHLFQNWVLSSNMYLCKCLKCLNVSQIILENHKTKDHNIFV